jgi:hypothetical protein
MPRELPHRDSKIAHVGKRTLGQVSPAQVHNPEHNSGHGALTVF